MATVVYMAGGVDVGVVVRLAMSVADTLVRVTVSPAEATVLVTVSLADEVVPQHW